MLIEGIPSSTRRRAVHSMQQEAQGRRHHHAIPASCPCPFHAQPTCTRRKTSQCVRLGTRERETHSRIQSTLKRGKGMRVGAREWRVHIEDVERKRGGACGGC